MSDLTDAINTLADGDYLRKMTRHNAADFVKATAVVVDAARQMVELEHPIQAVVEAIEVQGRLPRHHRKVWTKHRKEWPTLHDALTKLRLVWHKTRADSV